MDQDVVWQRNCHKVKTFGFFVFCFFVSLSPPELRGNRRREESLLPVGGPVRPEQPAGSSVSSHPVEENGESTSVQQRPSRFKNVRPYTSSPISGQSAETESRFTSGFTEENSDVGMFI